jgi:beta-glucosidase
VFIGDESSVVPCDAQSQFPHGVLMKRLVLLTLALPALASAQAPTRVPESAAYKNAKLPAATRVADLLSRMTLEEKVAQLQSMIAARPRLTDSVLTNSRMMDSLFKNGMGMMNPDFDASMAETIKRRNALQQYLKTKTRLGIPIIFIDEAHHGLLAPGVDVFPHSIALAQSWDTALVERVYRYIAGQAYSRGTRMVLSPVIDVTRDPRWGRTGETFGEDPYLNGMIGSAVVAGYQGSHNGMVAHGFVAATLKHFTGHGEAAGGINQGTSDHSERVLREFHMEPFRIAIQRVKPTAIMASYNDIDGIPSHANPWLLQDVLRKEWKYRGIVVSDWFAIDQLWKKHRIEPTEKDAARRAFNSGVTVDLPFGINYAHLVALVKEGKVRKAAVDSAVSLVLALKINMGLFEEAPAELAPAEAYNARTDGRVLAREAAVSSIVLLKNKDNLLPIRKDQYQKIAVIGPTAAVNYLGDYSGIPKHNVSLLEGIRNKIGDTSRVLYAPGVRLSTNGDTMSFQNYQYAGRVKFPTAEENAARIAEAVEVAKRADFVVVAVGENEQMSRESGLPDRFGDVSTLDLQGAQQAMVEALVATGKPLVVYLMHARPFSIPWIAENAPAIVDGWYNGVEAGNAFADILFGDANPSGKLTISYPRSVGHLPVYYNHKPSARTFEYVNGPSTPLFPFGFGLSYTTFTYSKPRLNQTSMPATGSVTVSVDVTNSGKVRGDEIVQLYIRQKVSSVTRPVKELKDFARIRLEPGETKTVNFTIDSSKLAFWNASMVYGVEAGTINVMVGRSSTDVQGVELTLTNSARVPTIR